MQPHETRYKSKMQTSVNLSNQLKLVLQHYKYVWKPAVQNKATFLWGGLSGLSQVKLWRFSLSFCP